MVRPRFALRARVIAIALLSAASWGAPARAQGPALTFGETIDVKVINVEVVVTDREGRRVTGLGPGDFRLTVDGEVRSIDYFTEVREGRAVKRDDGATRAAAGLEGGEAVGTRYLVFIDDYLTLARDRDRVLERLRGDLAELGPADRVAVVAFDGRKLELLTGWTGSQDDLDRVFAAAAERPTHGLKAEIRRKNILSGRGRAGISRQMYAPGPNAPQRGALGRMSPEAEEWARELSRWLEAEITAVSSALRSLSSEPGRKVALVLAGKWPFDPVARALRGRRLPSDELGLKRAEDLYAALADTANLLGFTLYPVDVAGVVGARAPLTGYGSESTFHHLASETGGKALLYDRRDTALDRTMEDTRSYYWLGFTAERTGDDRRRGIEVAALQPGLEVRSRQGYLDFSRGAEVTAAVESLLFFEQAGGIAAERLPIRPGAAERSGRKTLDLSLTLGIPVDRITMLPAGEGWVGDLELRVVTLDVNGDRSDVVTVPLHLESQTEPSPGGLVRYDTSLTLRRIEQEVVVSVFDPLSGRLLASRLRIDPKALLAGS